MKENDIDDILTLAFANLQQPEAPVAFEKAVERQPEAPLTRLIAEMLEEQPDIRHRQLLERLAKLNQGTPEDMDQADFQSYLLGRLDISEADLRECMAALGTYRRVCQAQPGEQLLAAARDESGDSIVAADVDEIRNQLKKRK
jgi:hypothetical protein